MTKGKRVNWVLIPNLVVVLLLFFFRNFVENTVLTGMGFDDPGKFFEGTLYTLLTSLSYLLYLRGVEWVPEFLAKYTCSPGKVDELKYSIISLDTKTDTINSKIESLIVKNHKEFRKIGTDMAGLDVKIHKIESARTVKDIDRDKLHTIRNNKVVFIKKLSPALYRFAIYKTNTFMKFVLDVHEIGFYTLDEDKMRVTNPRLNYETLKDDIFCSALKLRDVGRDLLGKEFMDFYYDSFMHEMESYICYIHKLIGEEDNYKHERFQERSEIFISRYLEMLHHSWLDFKEVSGDKNKSVQSNGE